MILPGSPNTLTPFIGWAGLAKDGLVIGINDIVEKIGEIGDLVAEIQSAGGRALSLPADVSTEVEVVDMVQKVVDEFGGLDVVRIMPNIYY